MQLQQIYYLQGCYLPNLAKQKYAIIIMSVKAQDKQEDFHC